MTDRTVNLIGPVNVVIIHRYPMLRLGIRLTGEGSKVFRVVGETADPDEGFGMVEAARADAAVLDMQFPDRTGFEVLRDLRQRSPDLRILIYCDVPIPDYPERCLRAGANGYMAMSEPVANFVQAISKILRGQIYLDEERSSALLRRLTNDQAAVPRSPVERLSEGELGVLTFIAKGMSNGQIARALHRSVKTVETYRSRIKRKVGVANATALAQFAARHFDRSHIHQNGEQPIADT